MAHHKSARKRIRTNARRHEVNHSRLSRIRTFIKRVEKAVSLGDAKEAKASLILAEPEIRRGVSRGVIHLKTASRKISRLHRSVKHLS